MGCTSEDRGPSVGHVIGRNEVRTWFGLYAERADENSVWFNDLDGACGDGDFGTTVQRGAGVLKTALPTLADEDLGGFLAMVASRLIAVMGGTSGPLLGTFFLYLGMSAKGKKGLGLSEWHDALEQGVRAVRQLGKAEPGDKTMVDALVPALDCLKGCREQGLPLEVALRESAAAAHLGSESTAAMIARRGRASYAAERSLGHIDPGAVNAWLLLDSLAAAVELNAGWASQAECGPKPVGERP